MYLCTDAERMECIWQKLTTYQVTEIAKDTWVINEAGMTAMFLLKGTERALLIDTGVGMTDLKKLISWLTPASL